jgi:tetratricopeptide (TPR) repeat protein
VLLLCKLSLAGLIVGGLGACATQPITKLVSGHQITTRSVDATAYEHVSRALLYEEQERWQDAATEIQRAIVFDSDAPELHAHLAEILLHMDRIKDAAAEVRDSLRIGISASGLVADAHVRRAQGDMAGVVVALRRAEAEVDFQSSDDDAETVYLELAEAELHTLDMAGARGTLETLCQAVPASGSCHMRLMAIHWAMGDMKLAEEQLRAALAEEPNQIEAIAALAWIYAASGRTDDARRTFLDALDRSEGSLDIAAAFARFLVGIGSNKDAEQLADDSAVPDGSLDAESLDARIELERSARRLDRALALLARGRTLDIPEARKTRLSFTEAALLKEQGKTDVAVATLMKVGKNSPLFLEARLRVAELLRDGGKTAEAARAVDEAMSLAKGEHNAADVDAAVSLALIDEKRADPAKAIERLEKLLANNPGDATESRATMTLAAIEDRRGNWKRALDLAEALLAKQPGSVEALNFWGFVAAEHDHALDLATKRIQVANILDPGSGGLIDSLGWVHFHAHDLDKASLFLEQAAHLEPIDPEIQWHLGELYAERKEIERAAATFRRALGFSPDERLRRKLEASLARLDARKVSKP